MKHRMRTAGVQLDTLPRKRTTLGGGARVVQLPMLVAQPLPMGRAAVLRGRLQAFASALNPWRAVRALAGSTEFATLCAGILFTLAVQQWFAAGSRDLALIGAATASEAPVAAPAADADAGTTSQRLHSELAEVLAIEPRSPLGRASAGVSRDDALALADTYLRGASDTPPSRLEARYWLKYALAPTLTDPTLPWALSQLGSIYAAPGSGLPDFKAASVLWQAGAALGDPVATCFLARMHELGAGVERDLETARRIYSMALKAGGCPGLIEALGRLEK